MILYEMDTNLVIRFKDVSEIEFMNEDGNTFSFDTLDELETHYEEHNFQYEIYENIEDFLDEHEDFHIGKLN